jgi:hypothetical protein
MPTLIVRHLLQHRIAVPLLMFAASLILRSYSFVPAVIDSDEGLYIVQAREWLRGGWPLVATWDMHPIGAPALFTLTFLVTGVSIKAVRLLAVLAAAGTGTALFAAARAAGLPRAPAWGAGILYIALTTQFGGLAANTEILFAPFTATAIALAVGASVRALDAGEVPRWRTLIAMGLLVGYALTIKPVATPEGSMAFAMLVLPALWRRTIGLLRVIGMAIAYALLCALPTLLFALAYWLQGYLNEFLDGSFLAPLRYAGDRLTWGEAAWLSAAAVLYLFWPTLLAAVAVFRPGLARRAVAFGVVWLAVTTVSVAGPGLFYNHYYLIWLPPFALLAACGAWHIAQRAGEARAPAAFALMVGLVAVNAWAVDAAGRLQGGIALRFPDPVRVVAEALRVEAPPGTKVLIANYHPVVYALADVALPSRYVFPAQLTGPFGDVAGIDMDAEVARILAERPLVIVVDRGWWPGMRPAVRAMLGAALIESYDRVAEIAEERGPIEIFRLR